jgi:voltage-dependent potassium channel beta subunit
MIYRRLGKAGVQVSALSYGSWVTFSTQLDVNNSAKLMAKAYDQGVNFFDNAETYADGEALKIMGKALKKLKWSRDSYLVSNKVFFGRAGDRPNTMGLSRKHVMEACNDGLRDLGVDYVDFYFCHRPDPNTPIEETVFAMNDLVRQGKVLYWGTSEWSAKEIDEANRIAKENSLIRPSMEQPQYNLMHRDRVEKEYAPLYDKWGMGTTIWSPLASGILTGKYLKGIPKGSRLALKDYEWLKDRFFNGPDAQKKISFVKQYVHFCEEHEYDPAQYAIAWCLLNKNVSTVILGATNEKQLQANLDSLNLLEKIEKDNQKNPGFVLSIEN